jgi:hypothetical protein
MPGFPVDSTFHSLLRPVIVMYTERSRNVLVVFRIMALTSGKAKLLVLDYPLIFLVVHRSPKIRLLFQYLIILKTIESSDPDGLPCNV